MFWCRRLFVCFSLLLSTLWVVPCASSYAQQKAVSPDAASPIVARVTLTVNIAGLRNAKGLLHVVLFNESNGGKGFPGSDKDAFRLQVVPVTSVTSSTDSTDHSATLVFRDLPSGVYAVALYHDENANGKMDTYWYGKPKEGSAASNNPRPHLRAPHFNEASFPLKQSGSVNLKLWYP